MAQPPFMQMWRNNSHETTEDLSHWVPCISLLCIVSRQLFVFEV